MIEIKKASPEEIQLIHSLCKEEKLTLPIELSNEAIFMLVKDGNVSLGFALIHLSTRESAIIKALYIKASERGLKLGDGLLRASLNLLNLMGVQRVYVEGNSALNNFLVHEGLEAVEGKDLELYFCEPEVFFNRPCKGSRRQE